MVTTRCLGSWCGVGISCFIYVFHRLFLLETYKDCMVSDSWMDDVWRQTWRREVRGRVEMVQLMDMLGLFVNVIISEDQDKYVW